VNAGRKAHWERVYATKSPEEVSWYQPVPALSLQLIEAAGILQDDPVLDVGGGASTLVDHLLDRGYRDVSVLDIAASALAAARDRLGPRASGVRWIEADVTLFQPKRRYALWHDRAVFHFLVDAADRDRYLRVLQRGLQAGGHLVLAAFGPEGPMRCSGLDVRRYSAAELGTLLGPCYRLRAEAVEEHRTPGGGTQKFTYGWWQAAA